MKHIFEQLDSDVLSQLFALIGASQCAIIVVRKSLHVSVCNDTAKELIGLRTFERIDELMSETANHALKRCIEEQIPTTAMEELDGRNYRVEMLPNKESAVIAFFPTDRDYYDGSLRIMQAASIKNLSAILNDVSEIPDVKLRKKMQRHAYRMMRTFHHNDFLHNLPTLESLHLIHVDMTALCQEVVENTQARCKCTIIFEPTEDILIVGECDLLEMALYNLLTNAIKHTKDDESVTLTLMHDDDYVTVSVTDNASPLDAALFRTLLYGWRRPMSLEEYRDLTTQGATLGFGLPFAQNVALLHGGLLLYSAKEDGGDTNKMHFTLAKLSPLLADDHAHTGHIATSPYAASEIELSVLD